MRRCPVLVLPCLLLMAGAWTAAAWSAELKLEEAILYVAAPAEVRASFAPEGQSATLNLPPGLVAATFQARQGEAALSPTLQPIYGPPQGLAPPKIERYQAQFSELRPRVPVELRFRTGGLGWAPSSALKVSNGQSRLTVQASITNEALDLTGARLRLMSGYVGGEIGLAGPFEDPADFESYFQAMLDLGRAAPAVEAGGLYAAAELEAPDIPRGSSRQVPLISADVAVTRSYRWDTFPRDEQREGVPVRAERAWALYSFSNSSGRPLPEGRVTVSEGGTVVGTGYAAWTPPGEAALVAVSSVQGVTVRRSEEATPQPKTWETQRTVKLRVENGRAAELAVRVVEHRLERWELAYYEEEPQPTYQFSQPPDTTRKGLFVWDLPVPARGEAVVTYSYQAPMDTTALHLIAFDTDDSPREHSYLVAAPRTSVLKGRGDDSYRQLQPEGYILYRLPMPPGVMRADLETRLGNAFRVSLAPEVDGKPGKYTVVADATAMAGRVVRDSSNRSTLTFDLTPFISKTSRAVYLLIDDPELTAGGAGAWVTHAVVLGVPEGYASRAPKYSVGEQMIAAGVAAGKAVAAAAPAPSPIAPVTPPTTAPPAAERKVLLAFTPYTRQEEEAIYYESGTLHYADGKAVEAEGRLIYAFTIPPDVPAATCVVEAGNMFALLVARDDGGKPGPYTEELNALKIVGRKVRNLENRLSYTIDLTPYLKDSPSRTVYLAVRPAMQYAGAAVFHVEVAALDDAERAQIERRQRRLDAFLREDRDRYQLLFYTNGSAEEAAYLYEDQGRPYGATGRTASGNEYLIYRLPLNEKMGGSQICALIHNTFLVTMALEENGKPGAFREAARGASSMMLDITSAMIAAGAVYLKFQFPRPQDPGGIVIEEISIRRP